MSYLRLSRDDYRTVSRLCYQLDLTYQPRPVFQRLLVEGLRSLRLGVADRIARLRPGELKALHDHFRHQHCLVERGKGFGGRDQFTPEEWQTLQTLTEACVSGPFRVRFVRGFMWLLVAMLHGAWPVLARKVARLSVRQFEPLYERARGRKKEPEE
jgi:hypothetical protein